MNALDEAEAHVQHAYQRWKTNRRRSNIAIALLFLLVGAGLIVLTIGLGRLL